MDRCWKPCSASIIITMDSVRRFFRRFFRQVLLRCVSFCVFGILVCAGTRLMGVIEPCGLGELISHKGVKSLEDLRDDCLSSNRALLDTLRESEFSSELMAQAVADAKKGRMSTPVKASSFSECGLGKMRLHPRFGIEQGRRPDGTMKIRSVDHFSWVAGQRRCKKRRKAASVNGHCVLTEKITHDHVDDIAAGMAELKRYCTVTFA